MAAWHQVFRDADGTPKLYRRSWAEASDPRVAEARSQTLALQRLQTWLRLGYAALALGVLAAYWGFSEGGSVVVGVVGIVFTALSLVVVLVLRIGIDHGRRNVNAILDALIDDAQTTSDALP